MKTPTLVAALVLVAGSGAALAQEATYEYPQPAVSQATRAIVAAERDNARAHSAALVSEAGATTASTTFVAARSRDDVRAEARQAVASGAVRAAALDGNGRSNAFEAPRATLLARSGR